MKEVEKNWLGARAYVVAAIVLGIFGFIAFTQFADKAEVPVVDEVGDVHHSAAPLLEEIKQLQMKIASNPRDAASLLALAHVYHNNGMWDPKLYTRATESYRKYLDLKPEDSDARVDLGVCYFEMGRQDSVNGSQSFSKALEEIEKVVASNPNHQGATFNMGIVNHFAGKTDEANKWFEKTVIIDGGSPLGQRARQIIEQHFMKSPH